jgi:putative DNA primase/helicase
MGTADFIERLELDDGYVLGLVNGWIEPKGGCRAIVSLLSPEGAIIYGDTVNLDAARQRQRFIQAVAARNDRVPLTDTDLLHFQVVISARHREDPAHTAKAAPAPAADEGAPREQKADTRPVLRADIGDLLEVVEATWDAIEERNEPPKLFRLASVPTQIDRDDHGRVHAKMLERVPRMKLFLAQEIAWMKADEEGNLRPARPPSDLPGVLLAYPDPPLPVLERVVYAPTLTAGGKFVLTPGYHRDSRLLYHPTDGLAGVEVSDEPEEGDIDLARDRLLEPLADFPFVSDADRAHAVAAMLLPSVRDLIDGPTPFHLIDKPAPATGAGLLVDVLTYPALGQAPAVMTLAATEEENRKRLTAKLTEIPPVVLLDNIRTLVDSSALSAVLTSTTWEDRILGLSRTVLLPVRALFIGTGNNVAVSDEIARRTVHIRLDAKVDRPDLRTDFKYPDLRAWLRPQRKDLVWAVLTIAQAWLVRGRPAPSDRPTMGRFEEWVQVMSGLLAMLGVRGLLANHEAFYTQATSEVTAWGDFVAEWWARFADRPVTVGDLWRTFLFATPDGVDRLASLGIQGDDDPARRTRFGYRLRRYRDRRFSLYTIRRTETEHRKGGRQWRLEGP